MTDWSDKDLNLLSKIGDPPQDPHVALLDHEKWAHIFFRWATDKKDAGNPMPEYLGHLESCVREDVLKLEEYYPTFFESGGQYPIYTLMPADLTSVVKHFVVDQADPAVSVTFSADDVKNRLKVYIDKELADYYPQFCKDVKAKQQSIIDKEQQDSANVDGAPDVDAAEETDLGGMTLDQIDTAKVATINEQVMKALKDPPNSKSKGESVDFWQAGEYVLLGDTHDPRYYKLLQQEANYCKGHLTMAEKGGAFGPGKIEVYGSRDPDDFKAAIRDFSKKKISFNV